MGYQEEVGTKVVDGVLEDIRLGMEINLPKFNQRRIAQVKYLGELYNYRMVESSDVFKVKELKIGHILFAKNNEYHIGYFNIHRHVKVIIV